jgi:hypothetical protein
VARGLINTVDRRRLTETNGMALSRHKPPLTKIQKLVFLSMLEATRLRWESFVVAKIFQFARDVETRCIIVSYVVSQSAY